MVEIGQVWLDCDHRELGERKVQVIHVGETHACVEVVGTRKSMRNTMGKRRLIRLDRMKPGPRGYRLLTESEE